VPTLPGSAFVVHFYFNFSNSNLFLKTLTDDDANVYSFLNVGNASCPASKLPGEVCCTNAGSKGTCQGWAIVTNAKTAPKNPAKITFTVEGGSVTTSVMGAEVFEIGGLADNPLDRGASMGLPITTEIETPTIMTSTNAELVLAGVAFYTSSSTLTPPTGWSVDQDTGYYAAAMSRIVGPAGSSYGGKPMGTITGMNEPGTSTILALMGK
jgi:hypothetical protein